MREFFFVLAVILILLALTAIRYRKQIAGIIGLARVLKDAKNTISRGREIRGEPASVQLINCPKCGTWVPESRAVKSGGAFYCSRSCLMVSPR